MINKTFIFILLLREILLFECLKVNDSGVCSVKSPPKTRVRIYLATLNKRCGKKKCTQKKTKVEKYDAPDILVCCNGWEYNNTKDICEPLCRAGCSQGLCVSPDVCQCTPPLYLDSISKNSCIKPNCNPSCVNSICIDTNNCSCDINYMPYNNTYCVPNCLPKYEFDMVTLTCKPICDTPCGNGTYFNGNEDYEFKNNTWRPSCDRENGVNITRDDNTNCKPVCENCDNGRCEETNYCECNEGYLKVHNTCVPFCEDNCFNGYTLSSDECNCYEEYTMNYSQICIKVVDCSKNKTAFENCTLEQGEQSVLRPKCVKRHKTKCLKTLNKRVNETKVVCCDGYYLENKVCKPQCLMGCDGGRCVEPETCQCDIPLVLNNETNACILPTCDPPCVNSICQNTNECHCMTGYEPVNTTHCAPKCSIGYNIDPNTLNCVPTCNMDCVNGTCSAPNMCTCDTGYKLKSDDVYNICSAVCNPPCENSVCTEPNVCTCHEGYTKTDNSSICEPECESCDHGDCVLPDDCRCHVGYLNIDDVCEPDCGSGCKNGYCSAPNHCTCDPGFRHRDNDSLTCIPNCDPECINSTCKAPNLCVCNEGFEKVDVRSCKPKCSDCLNGTCFTPEVCSCDEGYKYEYGLCKPICNETCDYGFCSSPNTCTCFDGFINGLNGCFIPCISECIGGTCNVLGECICDDKNMLINDTCQPILMINCDSCVIDDECTENKCFCDGGRPCQVVNNVELPESEARSSKVLAVLELTGAVCLILIVVLLVVIVTIWRKRKQAQVKVVDDGHQYGSVMYTSTVPNTLVKQNDNFLNEEMNDEVFENNINDNVEIDNYEKKRKSYKIDGEEPVESVYPLLTTNNTEL